MMNIKPDKKTYLMHVTGLSLVRITGADCVTFLNNQFINDLSNIDDVHWQLNGYCTAKGRLLSIMRLFKSNQDVYFIVPNSIAQLIIKRLQIYVFRADVSFQLLDDKKIFCIHGAHANETVQRHFPGTSDAFGLIKTSRACLLNLNDASQRYLLISDESLNFEKTQLLTDDEANQAWRLSEIAQGIPSVHAQTQEVFIPQHVNMDRLNGVSFKKGCFPGQEIIARLHYLGKSKKSMRKLHIESDQKLKPGDSIKHPQSLGQMIIVDAVENQENQFDCLVVGQFGSEVVSIEDE